MKETAILKADNSARRAKAVSVAAKIIRRGGIVAFPTETVYGLGADALNPKAVRKIFRAKRRPFDDPLIVHISNVRRLHDLAERVDVRTKILAERFWPGPLTLVLKKSKIVPKITTAGLGTVAVRMPSHKTALMLMEEAGCPIAAPSANLFGKPSPTSAGHVKHDLGGRIDAIIDGGKTRIGVESTVLDVTGKTPVLLRPGGIALEQLEKVIGKIKVHPLVKSMAKKGSKGPAARSPGMKYRHYAPKAEVIVVLGKKARGGVIRLIGKSDAMNVGVISGTGKGFRAGLVKKIGKNPKKAAHEIYSALREFDLPQNAHIKKIFVDGSMLSDEKGLGLAVKNRLFRAAARVVHAN